MAGFKDFLPKTEAEKIDSTPAPDSWAAFTWKPVGLALNSPHSAMDNNPLGLGGDDPPSQDSTSIFEVFRQLKLKKPTFRNLLINPPSVHAPTSPIPEEMLKDTNLLWYHLHKKDTTDGQ